MTARINVAVQLQSEIQGHAYRGAVRGQEPPSLAVSTAWWPSLAGSNDNPTLDAKPQMQGNSRLMDIGYGWTEATQMSLNAGILHAMTENSRRPTDGQSLFNQFIQVESDGLANLASLSRSNGPALTTGGF